MDRDKLPIEIDSFELPDDDKHYNDFDKVKDNNSSGFVDAIFLASFMLVCFMWGMLVVILR